MTMTTTPPQNGAPQQPATPAAEHSSSLVVVSNDPAFRLALEPTSWDASIAMCERFSRIQLCGCKTPEDVMVRVMAGRALGLTFMQSMQGIYVIEGKPSLESKLKVALILNSPACEYFRCSYTDSLKATYVTKRVNQEPVEFTFSIEDARTALLLDRGDDPKRNNWNRFPANMLRARAASNLADIVYPDVVRGMATKEEMEDERDLRIAHGGTVVEVSQPATNAEPPRDYDKEKTAILARMAAVTPATPKEERSAIRQAIADWDAPAPYVAEAKAAYNQMAKQTKQEPAAPPPSEPKKEAREPGID